jgi:hypothetical protein
VVKEEFQLTYEHSLLHLIEFFTSIDFLLQIGFNAGNGTQAYEYKPYSQASVLRDLTGKRLGERFSWQAHFQN